MCLPAGTSLYIQVSFIVYAYINSKTNLPYYIGKGKNDRAYSKQRNVSVPKDKSKIVFLEKNLTNIGALALERRYIEWYGRKDIGTGILLNKTEGGDCPPIYRTEQHKESIRKATLKVIAEGRHNSRYINKQLVAEGRHNFLGGEVTRKQLENGTHASFNKVVCPHCNKKGAYYNMKRYHFDLCKLKPPSP